MSDRKVRISIFAVSEKMTDLPEDRDLTGVWIDPAHTRKYYDTCGGGAVRGRPTSICEKNLIGVEDPYFGRMSVLIHEFGHTIQNIGMDQTTFNEVLTAYSNAQDQKLFHPQGWSDSLLHDEQLDGVFCRRNRHLVQRSGSDQSGQ